MISHGLSAGHTLYPHDIPLKPMKNPYLLMASTLQVDRNSWKPGNSGGNIIEPPS